jgi:membrane-associated protein
MDILGFILDFILHVDVHLANFVQAYGPWVYALLFVIIFVETGVVVMPFLPGDSLLFVVGTLCGAGLMSLPLSIGLLTLAAILGNQSNYTIGRHFMPFLRTFAPFVAGVAQMTRRKFTLYDVSGGVLWVGGVTLAGYLFGNIPWVKEHLDKIIWSAILLPGLLVLLGAWKARRRSAAA